ncbi:NAD(P)-binding protein [Aulographum hederae CBS 113979]|uniref:NAD(P)-binding protein n=1 Tax=Aulographum hederae CBS 113979 TaxID=1176131 RepID=A0A6G1GN87_9PEZI|nr:NAD(P)-binding protein [Aulographum hederae CBS 113979]
MSPPSTPAPPSQSLPQVPPSAPHILIIGAGSRGHSYSRAVVSNTLLGVPGRISCIAEPIAFKRRQLGRKFVWGDREPRPREEFEGWRDWVRYEEVRRRRVAAGEIVEGGEEGEEEVDELGRIMRDGKEVERGVDAVIICVLDELHREVVEGIAHLGLHVLCEKPLATSLEDTLRIYRALKPKDDQEQKTIFGICHVLRYSPHNMLLRELVREQKVVGEVLSIEHTEPVGWWHFSHSYVRGNWRSEETTAPSLLTKSCHDIDFILWMLCSPSSSDPPDTPPHLPSTIASSGSLKLFRRKMKPAAAGNTTNCLSCPIEPDCIYSAKKIYLDRHLGKGDTGWPVKVVDPEIEDLFTNRGKEAAEERLLERLAEDYDDDTPKEEVDRRGWYGRCVWESDNNVCDDQTVSMTWDDEELPLPPQAAASTSANGTNGANNHHGATTARKPRTAKSATFHQIAQTLAQCDRRGRIYGTLGELSYDSHTITVHSFTTGLTTVHTPSTTTMRGHGGGDDGLVRVFVEAVAKVRNEGWKAEEAQRRYLGAGVEEVVRSHVAVWAAEEGRRKGAVVGWGDFWREHVEGGRDVA